MSRKSDLQSLIDAHNRRLQKLKEQKASFGIHTPPHILTDIEDAEKQIKQTEAELETLDMAEGSSIRPSTDENSLSLTTKSNITRNVLSALVMVILIGVAGWGIYSYFTPVRSDNTLHYVIDLSAAMDKPFEDDNVSKWEVVKQKLVDELAYVPKDVNVGLRVFGLGQRCGQTTLLVEPYPNQADVVGDAIDNLNPKGSKIPLAEAIFAAYDNDLDLDPAKRNSIIVLTSGTDNCDPNGLKEAAKKVRQLGLQADAYIVGLSVENSLIERDLQELADANNGVFIPVNDTSQFEDTIRQIHENLNAGNSPQEISPIATSTSTSISIPTPMPTNTSTATNTPTPTITPTPTPNLPTEMNVGRNDHTSTLLVDGRVLVVGGRKDDSTDVRLNSAEIYDPETNTWTLTGNLNIGRINHTATLLMDRRVLVVGGRSIEDIGLARAEIYDPESGTWAAAGDLDVGRRDHQVVLLPTGQVLAIGGRINDDIPISSVEIFDPAQNSWSLLSDMNTSRTHFAATLLADGRVLVTGGRTSEGKSSITNQTEIFDPNIGTWIPTASMNAARELHAATLLPDDTVLIAGGRSPEDTKIISTEIYDLISENWSFAADMDGTRMPKEFLQLPNETFLVRDNGIAVYDPNSGTWQRASGSYKGGNPTLLADGRVLLTGGSGDGDLMSNRVEIYDPVADEHISSEDRINLQDNSSRETISSPTPIATSVQ